MALILYYVQQVGTNMGIKRLCEKGGHPAYTEEECPLCKAEEPTGFIWFMVFVIALLVIYFLWRFLIK